MTPEFFGCLEVETCCRCLAAPARYMTGHVTYGEHLVFAGWCKPCLDELMSAAGALTRELARPKGRQEMARCTVTGWSGHWVPAMGLRIHGSPSAKALRAAETGGRLLNRYMAPKQESKL